MSNDAFAINLGNDASVNRVSGPSRLYISLITDGIAAKAYISLFIDHCLLHNLRNLICHHGPTEIPIHKIRRI